MSSLFKNLLIALGITVLLGIIYFAFIKGDDTANEYDIDFDDTYAASDATNDANLEIEKVLKNTQEIESYRIDQHDDILTDPRFTSLIDRSVGLPDVGTGRDNPFAPVI